MLKETLNPTVNTGAGLCPPPSTPVKAVISSPYYLDLRANLADLASSMYLKPKSCSPCFKVLECGCGRRVVHTGCMNSDCPECYTVVKNRRGHEAFERFRLPFRDEKYPDSSPTVCYTIFTVPYELRHIYYDFVEWQRVRKETWHLLKTKYGAVYGLEASHPIGESTLENEYGEPTDKPLFAPHLNFLWRTKTPRESFIDVEQLRKDWAQILNTEKAVAYHQYYDKKFQVLQKCLYVCRPFPGYTQWKGSIRWYGLYPIAPKSRGHICPECGYPIKAIGIIDRYQVEVYDKVGFLAGRSPPWENDDNIQRFKRRQKLCEK